MIVEIDLDKNRPSIFKIKNFEHFYEIKIGSKSG